MQKEYFYAGNMSDGEPIPQEVQASERIQSPRISNSLGELRINHPGNPLLTNEFREVPPHFISVYRLHPESRLEEAATDGVRPTPDYVESASPQRAKLDRIFDAAAPAGYSRSQAIYAYPEYSEVNSKANPNSGNVVLEMKVDPNLVLVTDQDTFTEARVNLEQYGSPYGYEETYWSDAMTLSAYLALPEEERKSRYNLPEVIVPKGVDTLHVRVIGVR